MVAVGLRAPHRRLELPVHQVYDDGLIAVQVVAPRLLRRELLGMLGAHIVVLFRRYERLDFDAVQILVQTIDEDVEQLLAVLLLAVRKLLLEARKYRFK